MPRAKKSEFNKYFTKIFIISLFDKLNKWNNVFKQFKNRGIDVERFIAIDGRCKDQGNNGCLDKLKTFEMSYNVVIPIFKGMKLQELVPASSLTIGTIIILREMVKRKWKHVLICEDDVELTKNLEEKFKQGIKELGKRRWDVLYLGCGTMCGNKGISWEKTNSIKYKNKLIEDAYVYDKRDLRIPCNDEDEELCTPLSDHLSWAWEPGGTWAYAYSLPGARKMLKLIDNNAGNHIDQLLSNFTMEGFLKSIAFDPPIIMHEELIIQDGERKNTDIPWK